MKTIFIVDDEPLLRKTFIRCLSGERRRIIDFANPHDALAYISLSGDAPDLVVTDYHMPEMTGVAFAESLREAGYEMPILLLSGRLNVVPRSTAVTRFEEKPISMDVLRQIAYDLLVPTPEAVA